MELWTVQFDAGVRTVYIANATMVDNFYRQDLSTLVYLLDSSLYEIFPDMQSTVVYIASTHSISLLGTTGYQVLRDNTLFSSMRKRLKTIEHTFLAFILALKMQNWSWFTYNW